MIATVTLNPAVDQTIFATGVLIGQVNRARESQLDPAGKGVNVSRMVHRLGWPTVALGFLGGEVGRLVERALDDEGVQHRFVPIKGQTRVSVTVVDEAAKSATSLRLPGPEIDKQNAASFDSVLEFWLQASRVLVLAGRLPPGVPSSAYARYIEQAHAGGVLTILDADGEALREGVAARPGIIKPNLAEAAELLGRPLPNVESAVQAARELVGRGIGIVVISMGARGAVCAQGQRAWLVTPPAVDRRSTVGSGDSFVAGLAVAQARGDVLEDGLRLGAAAGAATAATPGTAHAPRDLVMALLPKVTLTELA